MSQQSEVIDDAVNEVTQFFRAAAGIGRSVSDRRRRRLWALEAQAKEKAAQMRQSIEFERRLAQPIIDKANDADFWETATQEQAAEVYGVCSRFATVDPQAHMAAKECERQINERWEGMLAEGEHLYPVLEPGEVAKLDEHTIRSISPTLPGEIELAERTEVLPQSQSVKQLLNEQAETEAEEAREAQASPDGLSQAQRERESERTASEFSKVLDEHEDIVSVRIENTEGYLSDGQVITLPAFHALRADGSEDAHVSARLDGVADQSVSPQLISQRLGTGELEREKFIQATNKPLIRGASSPSQDESKVAKRWDSPQAREQWAKERLAEGIDPAAVRAAVSGDMALSQPATMATAPARYKSGTERRPKAVKTQGRTQTLR